MTGTDSPIFKIVSAADWSHALSAGTFLGVPVDMSDGFIHFSARHQVRETAARHFSGGRDLLLVAVDPVDLGDALRWEPSRGGDLFPHLYAALDPARVLWVKPLPIASGGAHDFEGLVP